MPKLKRVAILTVFNDLACGFSVINVAETQVRGLLGHGYEPIVLVQTNCPELPAPSVWRREEIDLRPVIPAFHLASRPAENFEGRVTAIQLALQEHLADVDVVLTHDVMLMEIYHEHNVAVRRYAATRPDLLWLHWLHSVPTPVGAVPPYPRDCRYTPPPGYLVYPNEVHKPRSVNTYDLAGREWKVRVNRYSHAIDPLAVWPYLPLTIELVRKADFLGGEITAVFPARMDPAKQTEKIIRLLAGVQKMGRDVRLLIADWQCAGAKFQRYEDSLEQLAQNLDIGGQVSFTSRLHDSCSQGVPRRVVAELMDLSTVFIQPSRWETYSLVAHEAFLRGKLVILNHDLPPMRELYGSWAIYMDFSSAESERTYKPSEQAFWDDEAKRLLAELSNNRALAAQIHARKEWSPKRLWEGFESMFYLQPVGE